MEKSNIPKQSRTQVHSMEDLVAVQPQLKDDIEFYENEKWKPLAGAACETQMAPF